MAIITLLSDFGLQDPSAAIAKGLLLQAVPSVNIVDITHELQPFNKRQAAYFLDCAYEKFPNGTIHLCILDIYYDINAIVILCEHNGHYFIAPDNGVIPLAFHKADIAAWQCFEMNNQNTFHDFIRSTGIFINQLQDKQPLLLNLPPHTLVYQNEFENSGLGVFRCEVIHIDSFGNVVLNFKKEHYEKFGKNKSITLTFIQFEEIKEIHVHYNDVREGYKLCRFNSNGYLEICINCGRAETLFGLKVGGKNNNVEIRFR
ncbi:MAG: SAM-dependent chlorinase/fluorinase [Taibaiella sp.]|nr:SAM-dependent chlorinase/fluorinase [Taibaiella sp.]